MYVQQIFPPHIAAGLRMSTHVDQVSQHMTATLAAAVLGQTVQVDTVTETATLEVDVPASWWQHAKLSLSVGRLRRLLGPWLRRRPPRLVTIGKTEKLTVTYDVVAVFPWQQIVTHPVSLGAPVPNAVLVGRDRDTPPPMVTGR